MEVVGLEAGCLVVGVAGVMEGAGEVVERVGVEVEASYWREAGVGC
jgi:hypothetical protein